MVTQIRHRSIHQRMIIPRGKRSRRAQSLIIQARSNSVGLHLKLNPRSPKTYSISNKNSLKERKNKLTFREPLHAQTGSPEQPSRRHSTLRLRPSAPWSRATDEGPATHKPECSSSSFQPRVGAVVTGSNREGGDSRRLRRKTRTLERKPVPWSPSRRRWTRCPPSSIPPSRCRRRRFNRELADLTKKPSNERREPSLANPLQSSAIPFEFLRSAESKPSSIPPEQAPPSPA